MTLDTDCTLAMTRYMPDVGINKLLVVPVLIADGRSSLYSATFCIVACLSPTANTAAVLPVQSLTSSVYTVSAVCQLFFSFPVDSVFQYFSNGLSNTYSYFLRLLAFVRFCSGGFRHRCKTFFSRFLYTSHVFNFYLNFPTF